MADASALGIHPPSTIRIDMGGWVQDWPWECVTVYGDELVCSAQLPSGRRRVVFYPYEHARTCCTAHATGRFYPPTNPLFDHPPGVIFHGREDFIVTAGPPQPVPVN